MEIFEIGHSGEDQILSLVEKPAVKEYFSIEGNVITGVALISDILIQRKNEELIYYTKEAMQEIAEDMLNERNFNLSHDEKIDSLNYIESYCDDDRWIVKVRVNDAKLLEDIKNGKYNGFSIQGNYQKKQVY